MGQAEGLHRRSMSGSRGAGVDVFGRPTGMELRAMAVEFPVVHRHPNRLPFEGVLTLVDVNDGATVVCFRSYLPA